jgi:NADPH-dependent glutamate synthase beta subunit-like oxidoreductase
MLDGGPGTQRARGTGEYEVLPANLALVSIGYKGTALRGTEPWFDNGRGSMRNEGGRVEAGTSIAGGLYTAGWLKRGPSGIIGTNIADAKETVSTIMADVATLEPRQRNIVYDLQSLLQERNVQFVDWEGYLRIEKEEYRRRRSESQPREKIVALDDLLDSAKL